MVLSGETSQDEASTTAAIPADEAAAAVHACNPRLSVGRSYSLQQLCKKQRRDLQNTRVAIIGAGLSGMRAFTCVQQVHDAVSMRHGGRGVMTCAAPHGSCLPLESKSKSLKLGEELVGAVAACKLVASTASIFMYALQGASWIHGIEGNPLYRICRDYGLLVYGDDDRDMDIPVPLYSLDGSLMDPELDSCGCLIRLLAAVMLTSVERAQSLESEKRRSVTGADAHGICLATWDQDDVTGLSGRHVMIFRGYKSIVECLAAPPSVVAAAGAAAPPPPGPAAAAAGSAAAAVRLLLRHPKIHLNTPVRRVAVTEEGVTLQLLAGQETAPFDYCLITLPLGQLAVMVL
ncbi:flavin-containing protein amine oxidase domain-containing protein [Cyclospora cayetanensis]|uniref:Flavin-containing protein amine oxidase domain-containing protein n=1 Tax=Cyclospora cayetanensis TaxID=88456 RepID=A0A1D3CTX1_9EIME|nr:flavin-containing protein amine oxidase domain-containing protein [Cyclospora cayetanensis]